MDILDFVRWNGPVYEYELFYYYRCFDIITKVVM